jgi:hypothetical protein
MCRKAGMQPARATSRLPDAYEFCMTMNTLSQSARLSVAPMMDWTDCI